MPSPAVVERVLGILPSLYACRTTSDYLKGAASLIQTVIRCDECRWHVDTSALPRFRRSWRKQTAPVARIFPDAAANGRRRSSTLTIPIDLRPGEAIALSLRRGRTAFTELDMKTADMLRPHLCQAYANALACSAAWNESAAPAAGDGSELTARESQVGYWLARGKTNPEIAIILGAAPRTIEKHVESLLRKLAVENRTTAALVLAARFAAQAPDMAV
jgi:DNA-binding CsgD family transcriptional regulator